MAGHTIKSWKTEKELVNIDASSLKSGTYILKADDGVQTITTKLIKE